MEAASKQIEEEKKKNSTYEALLEAYSALQQQNVDEAALKLQNVYADLVPDDLKGIYNTICSSTGTTGIEGSTDGTDGDGSSEDNSGDTQGDTSDEGYTDSTDGDQSDSYDASGDSGDVSYDDSGDYYDNSYDESEY